MKRNYVPQYIYWELSNFCNLRCKHCFAEASGDMSSIIDQHQIQAKLEEMYTYGTFAVRFGGGEPLMVPYLFDLIKFCDSKHIAVDITTNGTLVSDDVLGKLQNAGLRELTISLDGLEETHDVIRGAGVFQRSLDSIRKALTHEGITTSVAFTVTALNYNQIESFVEEMVNAGVRKFYFFRYCENSNSDYLLLSQRAIESVSKSIYYVSKGYKNIKFIHEEFSFYAKRWCDNIQICEGCNFLKGVMSIDYCGNVVVCAAIHKVLGNIFNDKVSDVYRNIQIEQNSIRCVPTVCEKCNYHRECHGGCKSRSYHTDGTYRFRDDFCYIQS